MALSNFSFSQGALTTLSHPWSQVPLSSVFHDCIDMLDVFQLKFSCWKKFEERYSDAEVDPWKSTRWWAPNVSSVSFWVSSLQCRILNPDFCNTYKDLRLNEVSRIKSLEVCGELISRATGGTGKHYKLCPSPGCRHHIQISLREPGKCLFPFRTPSS